MVPGFAAGVAAAIEIRIYFGAIEMQGMGRARSLREGGHDEEYSATAERFEQRCGHGVVALSAIVECKNQKRLACGFGLGARRPQSGEIFEAADFKMLRGPFQLRTEVGGEGRRSFVHGNYEGLRLRVESLEVDLLRAKECGCVNRQRSSSSSQVHGINNAPPSDGSAQQAHRHRPGLNTTVGRAIASLYPEAIRWKRQRHATGSHASTIVFSAQDFGCAELLRPLLSDSAGLKR